MYTVEGLRDARAHLKPGGTVSLSFCVLSPGLGRKIYLMLEQAFGVAPLCIQSGYDLGVVFLVGRDGPISLGAVDLAAMGFEDVTSVYADPTLIADVSTDDWPFFYMVRRTYPVTYVIAIAVTILLSVGIVMPLAPAPPRATQIPFMLLGAGFMLVETRAITELGLQFGNTWQVVAIVIAGILAMGWLSNAFIAWSRLTDVRIPALLLLVSLVVGGLLSGGFGVRPVAQIAALLTVTSPLLFSGAVFSTLLTRNEDSSSALSANLIGAIVGGLLEYNAMYFGVNALYWLAFVFYASAVAFAVFRPAPATLQSA